MLLDEALVVLRICNSLASWREVRYRMRPQRAERAVSLTLPSGHVPLVDSPPRGKKRRRSAGLVGKLVVTKGRRAEFQRRLSSCVQLRDSPPGIKTFRTASGSSPPFAALAPKPD